MKKDAKVIYCDICKVGNAVVFSEDVKPEGWILGTKLTEDVEDICPKCIAVIEKVAKGIMNYNYGRDENEDGEPDREPNYV